MTIRKKSNQECAVPKGDMSNSGKEHNQKCSAPELEGIGKNAVQRIDGHIEKIKHVGLKSYTVVPTILIQAGQAQIQSIRFHKGKFR